MFKSSRIYPVIAAALALATAGCMDKEIESANNDCSHSYVGRQKSACQLGVNAAFNTAKASDGKTRAQKFKVAVSKCQKLEPPLVKACTDGVKNFRSEIAKLDSSGGRSPASN